MFTTALSPMESCNSASVRIRKLPGSGDRPSRIFSAAKRKVGFTSGGKRSERRMNSWFVLVSLSRVGIEGRGLEAVCAASRPANIHAINVNHLNQRIQAPISLASRLLAQIVYALKHFVCSLHHPRTGLIRPLRHNHLDEFFHHVHIRLFEIALLDRAQAFAAAGSSDNGIARRRGLEEQILADTIQPSWIWK